MQTATATNLRPVRESSVEPAVEQEYTAVNPTAIRYMWNPFKEISLVGPDGTMSLYVQPHRIEVQGRAVDNPLHRTLPRAQLLPFPTFNAVGTELSPDLKDSKGAAVPVQTTRAQPAVESVYMVLRQYSGTGVTLLNSLQGMDQADATRIFRVVHPFEYNLSDMPYEFTAGAEMRIEARETIEFDMGPGEEPYQVAPLRSETEREVARALAAELDAGAGIAITHAETIFSDTDISIETRLSGGHGKVAPDSLDNFVADQLGKTFTRKGAAPAGVDPTLAKNVEFLVDREVSREKDAEIAELRRQLAEKEGKTTKANKAPQSVPDLVRDAEVREVPETAPSNLQKAKMGYCGRTTKAGTECKSITKDGEPCLQHADDAGDEE